MTKIQRNTQKIFGANAPADDIAAMGSFKTGTPVYTDNIEVLQNSAYEQGYGATLVANEAPFMEEQNSVPYILSKQLAYSFQEGLAEYDANTTYYKGSIVKTLDDNDIPVLYYSLTDNNINNPLTDEKSWKAINLEIPPATSSQYGTVKVDNSSIKINDNGQIYSDSIIQKVLNANSRAGYVIFKSGFMMQWGIASTNGASGTAGVANVSLYIPMYCWQIQATVSGTGVGAFTIQVIPTSATGFQVITSSGGVWTNGIEFHWLAIGVKA